jgi:hypothetical protein
MIVTAILFATALAVGFLVGDYTAITRVRKAQRARKEALMDALHQALTEQYNQPGPWDHMLPTNAKEEKH